MIRTSHIVKTKGANSLFHWFQKWFISTLKKRERKKKKKKEKKWEWLQEGTLCELLDTISQRTTTQNISEKLGVCWRNPQEHIWQQDCKSWQVWQICHIKRITCRLKSVCKSHFLSSNTMSHPWIKCHFGKGKYNSWKGEYNSKSCTDSLYPYTHQKHCLALPISVINETCMTDIYMKLSTAGAVGDFSSPVNSPFWFWFWLPFGSNIKKQNKTKLSHFARYTCSRLHLKTHALSHCELILLYKEAVTYIEQEQIRC